MKLGRTILFLFFVTFLMGLTGCGLVSEEPNELVETIQENEEDKFFVDNIEIKVNGSGETAPSVDTETGVSDVLMADVVESNSLSETMEVTDVETELKSINEKLSEEDAIYMDLLLSSEMTDEELEEAIMQDSAFQSAGDKKILFEQAKSKNQSLSEKLDVDYINMSEDEELMNLIQEAQEQMVVEQATAEPISLN